MSDHFKNIEKVQELLQGAQTGLWSIELDEGKPPRMYACLLYTSFRNLHAQFAAATHGCLFRNALAWEEYWRWDEDDTVVAVYYDVNGKSCGYMVYLIKDDMMHIKEMIYLTREAHEGLWEYIRAHDSMIDEVRGSSYYNEMCIRDRFLTERRSRGWPSVIYGGVRRTG